jgi:hypothetical protein
MTYVFLSNLCHLSILNITLYKIKYKTRFDLSLFFQRRLIIEVFNCFKCLKFGHRMKIQQQNSSKHSESFLLLNIFEQDETGQSLFPTAHTTK